MENALLKDILLIVIVSSIFILGFFVMKRLDKFLDENYKPNFKEKEEKTTPTVFTVDEDASDEEILLDIKKIKESGCKVKIVISNDECDE